MPKGHYIPLTREQEQHIEQHYLSRPVKRIATELGITFGRVMRYLQRQQLTIPMHIIEQRKKASRIKPGTTAWNKGVKQREWMSPEAIAATKATQFKKGHTPHNTHPTGNGAIVTRRDSSGYDYKYIRIAKGHWELYHRYLWEQAHGPIPADHILIFRDGDSQHVTLDNLELITLSENMYRNSKHHYPPEIIPTLVLCNQLDKKLKHLQDEKHTIRP